MKSAVILLSLPLFAAAPLQSGIQTITLDIDARRISRAALDASLAVQTRPGSGIDLSVGAAVSAENVEIHLRRVDGVVRYRLDASKVAVPARTNARD